MADVHDLIPPLFTDADLHERDGIGIVADYWEENGECRKAEMLRRLKWIKFGESLMLGMETGSSVYGAPGCRPKDMDFICWGDHWDAVRLLADGWEPGGSITEDRFERVLDDSMGFLSVRQGDENIILTTCIHFLSSWMAAHDECLEKRPKTRPERVAIFKRHREEEMAYANS